MIESQRRTVLNLGFLALLQFAGKTQEKSFLRLRSRESGNSTSKKYVEAVRRAYRSLRRDIRIAFLLSHTIAIAQAPVLKKSPKDPPLLPLL
jgi:hypothetical protein